MKKCAAFFIAFITMLQMQFAQVFWSEAFGSGPKNTSIDPLDTGNGAWDEVANGSQGTKANSWFASKEECGNDPTECGSVCASDASLHVGSVNIGFCAGGDCGAAYLAASTSKTNKDAISPLISTVGYSGITLNFNYIGYGEGTQDVASWSYSCDGGATWTFVTNLTTNCCSGAGASISCSAFSCIFGCQGKWTAYSYSLPSSADNISNFQIKFNWKNDSDNNGDDPSFAVDDITLSYLVLPIELTSFYAYPVEGVNELFWSTASEINADHFSIERSTDEKQFIEIGKVEAAGNMGSNYSFTDKNIFHTGYYYRLKQVDSDGKFEYSNCIHVGIPGSGLHVSQTSGQLIITGFENRNLHFILYNTAGIYIQNIETENQSNTLAINLHSLSPGIYFFHITDNNGNSLYSDKFVIFK